MVDLKVNYLYPIVDTVRLKSVYKWMFLYKWPLYDHSWPFFCHMCEYLSQNWVSDGRFEVLNWSKSWLGQKLWHKMQIFLFIFFFAILCKNRHLHLVFFCVFVSFVITFVPIKILTYSAPQNDRLNLSFVKDKDVVGQTWPDMV